MLRHSRVTLMVLTLLLTLSWCAGMFGRGYWTPDEPREADIAWRMSWQLDKAVPLLAGQAFCEKPPLTYWIAALPIRLWGPAAWAARLPNLLYALITALSVAWLAARAVGRDAALIGAAAVSTLLLSYQVAIWLATDAALLAATAVALLGLHQGFYAGNRRQRVLGYTLMHAALGVGFLSKSAAAFMVPALAIAVLIVWEKRWRELLRWELYAGLLVQAALILTWVGFVYFGPDGLAHLKVFFWNNLVGRFAHVDAPAELQYAVAHRNVPGKYFLEMPIYLFPWTFAVLAALGRAWRQRPLPPAVRFAIAASLPSLLVLSLAATARNIYFAPALVGLGLLLSWWVSESAAQPRPWDVRALRATAATLLISALILALAVVIIGLDSWQVMPRRVIFICVSAVGLSVSVYCAGRAWPSAKTPAHSVRALFIAYSALLIGPLPQIYAQVDAWQDLESIARAVRHDLAGNPLALLHPDETTRAIIDMYTSTSVTLIDGAMETWPAKIRDFAGSHAQGLVLEQLPGRGPPRSAFLSRYVRAPKDTPAQEPPGKVIGRYQLPNGRRYVLLEPAP
jgi:4-amino-4-deoxy-L-arabinose transferase-like glycosyltransferase